MKASLALVGFSTFLFITQRCEAQQQPLPPIATGEILTSAFQIPIQTLNAVHDLLQATRGRINALQERYALQQQLLMQQNSNPDTSDRRRSSQTRRFNSKALYQPWASDNRRSSRGQS